MREIGATQNSLSEALEMTQGGLQHWLAGTRQPTLDDINRIADKLSTPRSWLTHGIQPDDTVDGLGSKSQQVLRRLIHLERSGPLPESFWAAVAAMTDAMAPVPRANHIKSDADSRNGTDG